MLKWGFLTWFCLAFTLAFAQSYPFKNYTTHDGLVQTDITDITQDKKGNIWIGTNGGISIFDGKKFTNYDNHDLLQSLRINDLLCDSSGIMWIATRDGLLRYENGFEIFFKPNPNHRNQVTCLSINSQNNLVFVCDNTVYQVKNNRAEKYLIGKGIDGNVTLASYDRDDNLWVVTTGMEVYRKSFATVARIRTFFGNQDKKQGLGFIKILGREGPTPYFVTNFGTLWANNDSLVRFVDQYPQFMKAKVGIATYVLEDGDSAVWVGGTVGLSKLSGALAKRYTKDNGFCDNSVSCIFTDREKNVWIGCTYNGVYKLSNEDLFYIKPPGQEEDLRHISDIANLPSGKTLLSTWGKGLFSFSGDSVSKVTLPPYVKYITSLLPLGDRTYIGWFGKGLWVLNNKTGQVKPVESFAREEAVDKIYNVAGNLLVYMLDNSCYLTDYNFGIKASIKLPEDFMIIVLKDKIYQISPFGQVDILDNNLQVIKRNLFPDISSRITEITCYRDNFLVGTFGQGLFVYNQWGKLLKRIDKTSGLNTNIITSLLVDGSHLFIGSNLGLIRGDLPDLRSIRIFKESDGMFNWECRQRGLKKLPDGGIMIATTNGPYVYHPDKDFTSQYTSGDLTISSLRYGDNFEKGFVFSDASPAFQLSRPIEYRYNQVSIILNGVSQRNPDDIYYHYQLSGYDSMWITTANPVITFSNLAPGDYKFKSYLIVGNFISKPVFLEFSIATPLTGKLWFQVFLVLLLSFLCWLLLTVGNRIYQKYIQTKMLLRLETDIAMKQKLTAQSLSHAQHHYRELAGILRTAPTQKHLDHVTNIYLKDISDRIELLWKKDSIIINEFHQYFDDLLEEYASGARLYHKLSPEATELSMHDAFQLLQLFSLYLFIGLSENCEAAFSLDSEVKANGQLFFRLYMVTHAESVNKPAMYHLLKEAIDKQVKNGVTIDVIENMEMGNMIVAELNPS